MSASEPIDALLGRLTALPRFGAGVGLHRMRAFCAPLMETPWWRTLDALKVTGSNGKGSVTTMAAAILSAAGLATGRYVSPHLRRFHERIALDGEPIGDDELRAAAGWCSEREAAHLAAHPGDRTGAFEVFTAIALAHFAARGPDALVLEAGIGGRYDSTRIAPGRVVALTSVDLEHTALLGATRELIAYDKADLCPEGGTLVLAPLGEELRRRVESYCALRGVATIDVERCARLERCQPHRGGLRFDLTLAEHAWTALELPLHGPHQARNAAVAVVAARAWLARNRPELLADSFDDAVRAGLAAVRMPGRFERVHEEPDVYVDVGHTPEAVRAVVETARALYGERPLVLVIGASEDKAVEEIVAALVPLARVVVCTRARHRGASAERVERAVLAARPELPRHRVETVAEATELALELARREGASVLVAGGLFLAVEAAVALEGGDPERLALL